MNVLVLCPQSYDRTKRIQLDKYSALGSCKDKTTEGEVH